VNIAIPVAMIIGAAIALGIIVDSWLD